MSSLVKVNIPKITDEQKRAFAQQYGVRFIHLTTKNPINTEYRECFWQTVSIIPEQVGKKRVVNTIWSTFKDGSPKVDAALIFNPNPFGMGEAWVPDSPYNRLKLAACVYAKNEAWVIDDEKVRQEIDEKVEQMRRDPELRRKEAEQAQAKAKNERWLQEQEEKRKPKDVSGINAQMQQIVEALGKLTAFQLSQISASIQGATESPAVSEGTSVVRRRGRPAHRIPESMLAEKLAEQVEEQVEESIVS